MYSLKANRLLCFRIRNFLIPFPKNYFAVDPVADRDSTYHPDADAHPDFLFDADPNLTRTLMRIRIQILASKKMLNPLKNC
jgi:hypothetical protein